MKKKDEDAFTKSIFGADPIKKKNRIEKKTPIIPKIFKKKFIKIETKIEEKNFKDEKTKSLFILEKSPINKRLKKGKIPIDRRIDFHGMSVLEAEGLFDDTIFSCYNEKLRCILFITGKGVMRKNINFTDNVKLYYGKIRESFLVWTKKTNLQKYILSVQQAGIEYGADGAFFIYLRKKN